MIATQFSAKCGIVILRLISKKYFRDVERLTCSVQHLTLYSVHHLTLYSFVLPPYTVLLRTPCNTLHWKSGEWRSSLLQCFLFRLLLLSTQHVLYGFVYVRQAVAFSLLGTTPVRCGFYRKPSAIPGDHLTTSAFPKIETYKFFIILSMCS